LIVSCQPVIGGPMDRPDIVAAFARAALDGGAAGLRIQGLANLRAVRAVTDAPVIGLLKTDAEDGSVFITPRVEQARALVEAGADIVAFDATDRPRPDPLGSLVAAIRESGALAMADCATAADGIRAAALGCEVIGSTLSGYTGGAVPAGPDLALVARLAETGAFVIAEGRYHAPADAAAAIRAGADAVVVGSAITRPEHVTGWFAAAIADARRDEAAQ
jgi:N-acylglucosamine-6-phosphate 2-epimerase